MNVSWKIPLIPYITKNLTPCSSYARKAGISFTFNRIALAVRLSPLLSTPACIEPPPRRSPDAHTANIATCAPPTALPICDAEVRFQKVKLLIPGHIPGSFCEFRFLCLILSAFRAPGVLLAAVVGPATAPTLVPTRGLEQTFLFQVYAAWSVIPKIRPYHILSRPLRRMRHIILQSWGRGFG